MAHPHPLGARRDHNLPGAGGVRPELLQHHLQQALSAAGRPVRPLLLRCEWRQGVQGRVDGRYL